MIKIARVSSASQGENRTYRLDFSDGSSQFVDAPSKQEALELYYERRIARLQSALARSTPTSMLPTVGAALRNGGIHPAERGEHGVMDYINVAKAMGFEAETHTRDSTTYLRIAPTVAGLNKLKGQIDKTVR